MYKSLCSVIMFVAVIVIHFMPANFLDMRVLIQAVFFVGGYMLLGISFDEKRNDKALEDAMNSVEKNAYVFKMERKPSDEESDENKEEK